MNNHQIFGSPKVFSAEIRITELVQDDVVTKKRNQK